jgi:hypothetical protein
MDCGSVELLAIIDKIKAQRKQIMTSKQND